MMITKLQPPIKLGDNGFNSTMIIGDPKAWCSSAIEIIIRNIITQSSLSVKWSDQPAKVRPDYLVVGFVNMIMLMVGPDQDLQRRSKSIEKLPGAKSITINYLLK